MRHRYEKILVTGGAGFIGSHIVDKLIDEDFDVTVIDNLCTGNVKNLDNHLNKKKLRFVKGDIRDLALVKEIMKDIDAVFHEAALASVIHSVKDPIDTNQVNVGGTLNLLKTSSDFGVKRFIFASSAAVYGDTNSPLKKEDVSPNPRSPYGVSKLAAENYARVFYKTYNLETVCLRYFNVYGPRQNFDIQGAYGGAITIFTNRLLRNMPPVIYGDGKQTRDFIYIKDIVEANMLALKIKDAAGEVFNVGTGMNISLNQVADILKEKLNKQRLITIYTDPRPADVRHGYADISKIKRILGFNPKISPEEGLANLVNWYKKIVDP